MHYRLSPTTLNLFLECKRCFWQQFVKDIHRPAKFFPSLPSGMDNVIKDYYDKWRSKGELPPELVGKVPGMLVADQPTMDRWRNWRTGLEYVDPDLDATLFGALDDCLMVSGAHCPLDYKTRGFAPKPKENRFYYANQLDCYALLLKKDGRTVGMNGWLVYYWPMHVAEHGAVKFAVEPVAVPVDPERARATFRKAVECLRGPEPRAHAKCTYCARHDPGAEGLDD